MQIEGETMKQIRPNTTVIAAVFAIAACLGITSSSRAQSTPKSDLAKALPPAAIPTFSTENLARRAFFYAGGKYVGEPGKEIMEGAMYTEVWVPKKIQHPYPIVFFHGNGQTGTNWQQTPDNRAGWAYFLISKGYVLYMVDYPARGRSPYVPGVDGKLGIRTALDLESIWTAPAAKGDFPRKEKYTQWPSDAPNHGQMGDPVFDNFAKTQVQFVEGQAELAVPAGIALLDQINTPVILLTHSQGGGIGWNVADARPNLVKGIVSIESGGPQIGVVDTAKVTYIGRTGAKWGLTNMPMHFDPPINDPADLKTYLEEKSDRPDEVPCYLQQQPVHKLVNLEKIRVLTVSAEGTYHRVFDACIPKWLNQAGVKADFVRLEDAGIRGNMHEMFLDRNSDEVIKFLEDWIVKNVK